MADNKQHVQFMRQIAQMEPDQKIGPHLIRQAKDLIQAYGRGIEPAPEIQQVIPQICIMLIKDRGGSVTYKTKDVDTVPGNYLLGVKAVRGGKAIKFDIQKKPYKR